MSSMPLAAARAAARVAERFGLQVHTTTRRGIEYHVDISHIRPMRHFRRVLDVGAHWGESARFYRRLCPVAHITCFEPVRENFVRLQAALRRDARVEVINAAVGAAPGVARMNLQESSFCHTLVGETEAAGGPVETVTVSTLDEHCKARLGPDERIDLLKIDTEGFEVPVLQGAAGLLAARRVDFVYAEVTFDPNDPLHGYFPAVAELLAIHGYRLLGLYEITHYADPWRIFYCNALFTHL